MYVEKCELRGVVRNGVVVIEGDNPLVEGTVVRVSPVPINKELPGEIPEDDPIYRLFELAGPTGISDLSRNRSLPLRTSEAKRRH